MQIHRPSAFFHNRATGLPNLGQNAPMRRIAIVPVLLLAGLLAACGGANLASDPGKVLASAKLPPPGPNSSTLKVDYTPQGGGAAQGGADTSGGGAGALLATALTTPVTFEATSQGDVKDGYSADGKITLSLADIAVSARGDKTNTWVQIGGQWYAIGQPLPVDLSGIGSSLGSVATLIRDPKATAVEDVDGISCDRISGTLDPGASLVDQLGNLADNLPIDLTALKKGTANVSVWVGRDDHVIHRVQIDTAGSGDKNQTGGLSVDFSVGPGKAVTVTPPAGAKPITDLIGSAAKGAAGQALGGLDLSKLLGGAGGKGLDLSKLLGGMSTTS